MVLPCLTPRERTTPAIEKGSCAGNSASVPPTPGNTPQDGDGWPTRCDRDPFVPRSTFGSRRGLVTSGFVVRQTRAMKPFGGQRLPSAGTRRWRTGFDSWVPVLFLASGAAGLIYQVVWTQDLVLIFGDTTLAIVTTVSAFLAGLGIGSLVGAAVAARLRRALAVYGLLEITVGCLALLMPLAFGVIATVFRSAYLSLPPAEVALIRFGLAFVALAPVTMLMGMSLPVLTRHLVREDPQVGDRIARLYGLNTLGAVAGSLASGYLLIELIGLRETTLVAVGLNLFAGGGALLMSRVFGAAEAAAPAGGRAAAAAAGPAPAPAGRHLYFRPGQPGPGGAVDPDDAAEHRLIDLRLHRGRSGLPHRYRGRQPDLRAAPRPPSAAGHSRRAAGRRGGAGGRADDPQQQVRAGVAAGRGPAHPPGHHDLRVHLPAYGAAVRRQRRAGQPGCRTGVRGQHRRVRGRHRARRVRADPGSWAPARRSSPSAWSWRWSAARSRSGSRRAGRSCARRPASRRRRRC